MSAQAAQEVADQGIMGREVLDALVSKGHVKASCPHCGDKYCLLTVSNQAVEVVGRIVAPRSRAKRIEKTVRVKSTIDENMEDGVLKCTVAELTHKILDALA